MSEEAGNRHWRRNLAVCVFGCVTTITAMTMLLPFLPIYVAELGVKGDAAVAQWSGIAFGATFLVAALCQPLWGHLADRYGRKLMLVRAALGMTIAMPLIGLSQTIWQLVGFRLLVGLLGGYASGATVLVATQTPRARIGQAMGILQSGIMAGSLIGPLAGGALAPVLGIRNIFFAAGGVIFITFVLTVTLVREDVRPVRRARSAGPSGWASIPDKRPVVVMLITGLLMMTANMSVEPIITVFVAQLVPDPDVTLVAGLAMAAGALGSILSGSWLGKLADRVGHWTVVIACLLASGAVLVPQAFVIAGWQLVALRFLMGLALGGLLPCITAVIRNSVPDGAAGGVLGYSTSAQFAGQVVGPVAGGVIGGHLGMRAVFLATSLVMVGGAAWNWAVRARTGGGPVNLAQNSPKPHAPSSPSPSR